MTTELPKAQFGFPGPLRDQLVDAILEGSKTATSGLFAEYQREGAPVPEPGERQSLVDSHDRQVAIIEIIDVGVKRLADVDLGHAMDEGEGYLSVQQWRAGHERFWRSPEMQAELGGDFVIDDDTLVVVERFRVVD